MLLAGTSALLVRTWLSFVRRTILGPSPTYLGAGLIVFLLTVFVVQYAYRTPASGASSLVGRGFATIAFGVIWLVLALQLIDLFSESSRFIVGIILFVALIVASRRPKRTITSPSPLRFFQDPRGAGAFVSPLMLLCAAAIAYFSPSSSLRIAWQTLSESSMPAAQTLGTIVGAAFALLVAAGFGAIAGRNHPAWLGLFAAVPAIAASILGVSVPTGPVPYAASLRLEEQATNLAAQWWYGSQFTACGFYMSAGLLILAGLFAGIAACREGLREETSRRQTIIATLGPLLLAACLGYTLYRLQSRVGRDERYDLVFFPAAVALASLSIVHLAAGTKVVGKYAVAACACALVAMASFALAQALPAGSNTSVLELAPFEWVLAAENIPPKQLFFFIPAISFLVPLVLACLIALRGLSFSWKNVLLPFAPGFVVLFAALGVTSKNAQDQQQHLATMFRALVPNDVTLASGPPQTLTSCNDVKYDSILFVGRQQVTLEGQTIAATKDLESSKTCVDIARRFKGKTPRLAIDESIPYRQVSCLLEAFGQQDPRICKVVFLGRCKAGTHIAPRLREYESEEMQSELPACTEQMQENVPLCSERKLDVPGCRTSADYEPVAAMTTENIFVHGEYTPFSSSDWPAKPIDDHGQWRQMQVPRWGDPTLGVADDVPMRQLMALLLLPNFGEYHLHPSPTVPNELPARPKITTPLGVRVLLDVKGENEDFGKPLLTALEKRKDELRRCLEPDALPWLFDKGSAHIQVERNGTIKNVWPMHHADARFGGCITKILRDIRVEPITEPRFLNVDVRISEILPVTRDIGGPTPTKVEVDPPNESLTRDISQWSYSMNYALVGYIEQRKSAVQCLLPALFAHTDVLGEVDIMVVTTPEGTRVRATSKTLDKAIVTCFEEHAQKRLKNYFGIKFKFLPQSYQYYNITVAPRIRAEFSTTIAIQSPSDYDL